MTSHVRKENGDSNGFAGGLRLSWGALAVLVAAVGVAFTVANTMSAREAKAIGVLGTELKAQLSALDTKLDTVTLKVEGHCANPDAHTRP